MKAFTRALDILSALTVGLAFRLLALRFNWQMPKFVYRGDWH